MRVLIVEDERLAAERLQSLLLHCDPRINVVAIFDSIAETVEFFRSGGTVDLLMLDIEVADGRSFAIFDQVELDVPVIFSTAYDHYALQAFRFFSVDYLLKPVQREELRRALDKMARISISSPLRRDEIETVRRMLSSQKRSWKERFMIRSGNKLQFRYTKDVAYFFAEDKTVYLVTREDRRRYIIDHTLEELEQLLDPDVFFRISRKYIVSVDSLHEVKTQINGKLEIRMNQDCEHDLSVSRERAGEFKAWLNR